MRGFSRRRKRASHSRRSIFTKRSATLELLEDRRMLTGCTVSSPCESGGVQWTMVDGQLTIDDRFTKHDSIVLSVIDFELSPEESARGLAVNGDILSDQGLGVAMKAVERLTIYGGSGADTIDVSSLSRNDVPLLASTGVSIIGGGGGDTIVGSVFSDTIEGGPGRDFIYGGDGDDHLDGGHQLDSLFGGAGDDVLDPGETLGSGKPKVPQVLGSRTSFNAEGGVIDVRFNQQVSVDSSSLVLVADNGQAVDTSGALFSVSDDGLVANWELTSMQLTDTGYTYVVPSAAVADVDGVFLDGDADGIAGGSLKGRIKISNPTGDTNPKVLEVKKNGDDEKHAELESVTIKFDSDIGQSVSVDDLTIKNSETNESVEIVGVTYDPATKSATWIAAEDAADVGYYVATLNGNGIETDSGKKLAGNFGQAGTSFKQPLLVTHEGDLNLDGFVSGEETSTIIANIGSGSGGWASGDVDSDGSVAPPDAMLAVNNAGLSVITSTESELLEGGLGNDTFLLGDPVGLVPVDLVDGANAGVDTIDFSEMVHFGDSFQGIVFDLSIESSIVNANNNDRWSLMLDGEFENVIGTAHRDQLTGNALRNRLVGLGGADQLDGGANDDQLEGGLGDDTYVFSGDISLSHLGTENVVELAGQGVDELDFSGVEGLGEEGVILDIGSQHSQTVLSNGDNHLGFSALELQSIENVIGTSAGDTIAGNDLDNEISGGAGEDFLFGRRGDDLLFGEDGRDFLRGGDGYDEVRGGPGFDNPEIIDNSDPGFSGYGGNLRTDAGFFGDYLAAANGDILYYTISDVPEGNFDVFLTWPYALDLDGIHTAGIGGSHPVNQFPFPGDAEYFDAKWHFVRSDLPAGNSLLTLHSSSHSFAADAVLVRQSELQAPSTGVTVQGVKFDDENRNGIQDNGEQLLEDWMIFIDENGNGIRDGSEPFRVTGEDGEYAFEGLVGQAEYQVREVNQPGWSPINPSTSDAGHVIAQQSGAILEADFANARTSGTVLIESDEFLTEFRQSIELDGRRSLGINLENLLFDESSNPAGMGDAVELALVREDGTSWVPSIGFGTDAFFNQTEGQERLTADGVSYGEGYVTVDVSNLPIGESATLVARLLNNDNDRSSSVTVSLNVESETLWGIGTEGYDKVDIFFLFDDTSTAISGEISEFRNLLGADRLDASGGAIDPLVEFSAIRSQIESTLSGPAMHGIDVGFGVGRFEGYAYLPEDGHTTGRSRPFILNQPIVAYDNDGRSVDNAISSALSDARNGLGEGGPTGDGPETLVEALYQLATGLGYDGNAENGTGESGAIGSATSQILDGLPDPPSASGDVPSIPTFIDNGFYLDPRSGPQSYADVGSPDGRIGAAGFREGALPVIVVLTDEGTKFRIPDDNPRWIAGANNTRVETAQFEAEGYGFASNGNIVQNQTVANTLHQATGAEATIQQAVDALVDIGAKVIGVGNSLSESVLKAFAEATGAPIEASTGDTPAYINLADIDYTDPTASNGVAATLTAALSDYIAPQLSPQPNTLFEFTQPFESDGETRSHGQVEFGATSVEIADMAIGADGTAFFLAQKIGFPILYTLNLEQLTFIHSSEFGI